MKNSNSKSTPVLSKIKTLFKIKKGLVFETGQREIDYYRASHYREFRRRESNKN